MVLLCLNAAPIKAAVNQMAIPPLSAAITACEERNWTLSNLALQKILYLAHMTYMGRNKGAPLVNENFEAWDYGPVLPSLYQNARIFGSGAVESLPRFSRNLARPEHAVVRQVTNFFGDKTPGELVDLTHRKNGAWDRYYRPKVRHIQIPNQAILTEYRSKVG